VGEGVCDGLPFGVMRSIRPGFCILVGLRVGLSRGVRVGVGDDPAVRFHFSSVAAVGVPVEADL
jgi:hypothetical protein